MGRQELFDERHAGVWVRIGIVSLVWYDKSVSAPSRRKGWGGRNRVGSGDPQAPATERTNGEQRLARTRVEHKRIVDGRWLVGGALCHSGIPLSPGTRSISSLSVASKSLGIA